MIPLMFIKEILLETMLQKLKKKKENNCIYQMKYY